uniref:ShKT domain-containing protein n=1 Tax=Angiostrongylus cantonensis TaxID=6313 RepID=A0A0K0DMD4_ANGCA
MPCACTKDLFIYCILPRCFQTIKQMDNCRLNCNTMIDEKMRKMCFQRCGIL